MRIALIVLCSYALFAQTTAKIASKVAILEGLYVTVSGKSVHMDRGWFVSLDTPTGQYVANEIQSMTTTYLGPTNVSGVMRVEITDTPFSIRCLLDDTLSIAHFTSSSCLMIKQSYFSKGAMPVASVTLAGGQWTPPTNYFSTRMVVNYRFTRGLTTAGSTVSVNDAVVPFLDVSNDWRAKQSFSGLSLKTTNPASTSGGDVWYGSGRIKCNDGGQVVNCTGTQSVGGTTQLGRTGDLGQITLLPAPHMSAMYRVCGEVTVVTGSGVFNPWALSWGSTIGSVTRLFAWDDNGLMTASPSLSTGNSISMCRQVMSDGTLPITINPGDAGTSVYNMTLSIETIR